jgi:pyruvate carboxylase
MPKKTPQEKIKELSLLDDKGKNLKIHKEAVENITKQDGFVDVLISSNGERRKIQLPASLITQYLASEIATTESELQVLSDTP